MDDTTQSNDLMTAFVRLKADLSGLSRDTATARRIVDGGLAKPVKITVNSEPIVQAGKAAADTAAKIKSIGNADTSRLARGIGAIDQAFAAMSRSASDAKQSAKGITDLDTRRAEAGVDRLAGKVRKLGEESRRAGLSGSGGVIVPGGGAGHHTIHTRSGGFARSAAGSFAGGAALRGFGGAVGSVMRTPIPIGAGAVGAGALGAGLAGAGAAAVIAPAVAGFSKVVKDGLPGIEDEKKYIRIFDALLKDTEKAKQLFNEMAKIDLEVPIDLPNLLESTQKLAQAGITASEIPEKMRIIMDAAASSTEGALGGTQRIVHMISKINASGILEMEDLKSLSNMGLPIAEIIREKFNMNLREVSEATREGRVQIQEVIDGMFDGLESRFKGNIGIEIETIAGQIKLLQSAYSNFAGEVARPLFDPLLDGLKAVNDYLRSDDFQAFADGLKTISKEAAETVKVLGQIYGNGESMGIGAAIGGIAGGAAKAGGETIRGMALLADAGSQTGYAKTAAGLGPLFGIAASIDAGLRTGPNTDQPGVGQMMRGGIDVSLSQEQRFAATASEQERSERISRLARGIEIGERYRSSVAEGDQESFDNNLAASRAELERLREESSREFEDFQRRERATQSVHGLGVAGRAVGGMASGYGRGLMGFAGDLYGAAGKRINESTGMTMPSLAGIEAFTRQTQLGQEKQDVAESVRQRIEREKREAKEADRAAQSAAEKRLAQWQDDSDDETIRNSRFRVKMQRGDDGTMRPIAEMQELFQQSRGTSQTTGLGGLNAMMQSNLDAAENRRLQKESRDALKELVRIANEQLNREGNNDGKPDGSFVMEG